MWYQEVRGDRFEFRVRRDVSSCTVSPPLPGRLMWRFQAEYLLGQDRNSVLKMKLKFK